MEISKIKVKFGMTQNLGDYSNCRPDVEFSARLNHDDDVIVAVDNLVTLVKMKVHDLIDDELERVDRSPKYFEGPLFMVAYSTVRNCIVIYPEFAELPKESNWKDRDSWSREYYCGLRRETAVSRALKLNKKYGDAMVVMSTEGSFDSLPPLPDPGPAPLWHEKGLRSALNVLHIVEEEWESLAALDHVTVAYLETVREWRRSKYGGISSADLLAIIRENRPLEVDVPDDEPDFDDEDWE